MRDNIHLAKFHPEAGVSPLTLNPRIPVSTRTAITPVVVRLPVAPSSLVSYQTDEGTTTVLM